MLGRWYAKALACHIRQVLTSSPRGSWEPVIHTRF